MKEPQKIKDISIYYDVTVDDLHKMLSDTLINLQEFYEVMETGKLSNDKIQIYKMKNNKK